MYAHDDNILTSLGSDNREDAYVFREYCKSNGVTLENRDNGVDAFWEDTGEKLTESEWYEELNKAF